ncbi:MAG: Rab family GTPase [Candidatus Roizmanbacteria bacterium]
MQTYKLVLLGDAGVGKTSLLRRVASKEFKKSYQATFAAEISGLQITETTTLIVWDCAGNPNFGSNCGEHYLNSDAALVMFDLTSFATFKRVVHFMTAFRRKARDAVIILCGTKSDLGRSRQVTLDDINKFCTALGLTYFETSAKEDDHCDLPFLEVVKQLTERSAANAAKL